MKTQVQISWVGQSTRWSLLLLLFFSEEEEKLRRKWRKTFGEGKLMVTPTDRPTNRQGEYSAICLFKGWKIKGRDLRHTLIFLVCQFCLIMRSKTQKSKISDVAKRDCRLRMKIWYLLKQTIILLTKNIAFPLVFVFSRRWLTCKREETRSKIYGLGLMEWR